MLLVFTEGRLNSEVKKKPALLFLSRAKGLCVPCPTISHFPFPAMPMLCLRLCPNKPPFLGCSLWMLIFPIKLSHQLKQLHILFLMSLEGLILDLQFLITLEGMGEKKTQKTPPAFKERGVIRTRCGGSESSWLFLGGGFLCVFSFPKAVSQPLPRTGQGYGELHGLSVAADAIPLCLPRSPSAPGTAAAESQRTQQQLSNTQGHWQISPHCSAGWSCSREIQERHQKQSERMENQHNQTWLK